MSFLYSAERSRAIIRYFYLCNYCGVENPYCIALLMNYNASNMTRVASWTNIRNRYYDNIIVELLPKNDFFRKYFYMSPENFTNFYEGHVSLYRFLLN